MALKKPRFAQWQLYAVPCEFDDVYALIEVESVNPPGSTKNRAFLRTPMWLDPTVPTVASLTAEWPTDWKVISWVDIAKVPSWWIPIGETPEHLRVESVIRNGFGSASGIGATSGPWVTPSPTPATRDGSTAVINGPTDDPDPGKSNNLHWNDHERRTIDLSHLSSMFQIALTYGDGLEHVELCDVYQLALRRTGDGEPPTVNHPAPRRLALSFSGGPASTIEGVAEARSLDVRQIDYELDASTLAHYPNVERISLSFEGGSFTNLEGLSVLKNLKLLHVWDLFEFDPMRLPTSEDMPRLGWVVFDGIRTEHASAVREQLAGVRNLEIRHKRSDQWIAENANNPLRFWEDLNATLGRRAAKAWVKAKRAAGSQDPETAIRDFLRILNTMATTLPIESAERDDALLAVELIGIDAGANGDDVRRWFDQTRDF